MDNPREVLFRAKVHPSHLIPSFSVGMMPSFSTLELVRSQRTKKTFFWVLQVVSYAYCFGRSPQHVRKKRSW